MLTPKALLYVLVMIATGAVASGHARVTAEAASPGRVAITTGSRTIEGSILVEAVDGGVLLEDDDGRYEVLKPGTITLRSPTAGVAPTMTPKQVAQRIVAELPAGFDAHVTKHYIVCFNTSRDYAVWCATIFEQLYGTFTNFWTRAGFDLNAPPRPLVVVIFASRGDYEAYATRDLGAAADRVVGYYNLLTNRVTTYDLTGTDLVPTSSGRTAGGVADAILASPEAAGLVATLVHEATHQVAYNTGMHRRLAPIPLWLSEGLAMHFETPNLQPGRGWRGLGGVNRPRLDQFVANYRRGTLEAIVTSDDPFRTTDRPLDAYAAAWALTRHLLDSRKDCLIAYLTAQAAA